MRAQHQIHPADLLAHSHSTHEPLIMRHSAVVESGDALQPKPFLTAEWRHLAMLNFPIEPARLEALVPKGTMLDTYRGVAYVSLVGFLFKKTKVLGIPLFFHQQFQEVNLRFYVRRFSGDAWRRGVVFIKEI